MKKAFISLVAVLLSFSLAVRADSGMEDLPTFDPNAGSNDNQGSLPPLPPPPAAPNTPNAPVTPASEAGTLRIQGVSRATGGTVYRIQLSPAASLQKIAIRVNGGNVVISKAAVNTSSGSFAVRNLVSPDVLGANARLISETLSQGYQARSIDLRMEAYGGTADVTVSVSADRGVPNLSLGNVVAPTPPSPPAPPSAGNGTNGRLAVGARVMDAGDRLGFVKEIFSNGKVKVKLDGYYDDYFRDAGDLALAVKCFGNKICMGTRVIDSGDRLGNISEVFDNGKVTIKFDGYSSLYVHSIDDLAVAVRCAQEICSGRRVMDSGDRIGLVGEVFSNGRTTIKFDGYSSLYVRDAGDLGVGIRCIQDLCSGRRVMDSNDRAGVVGELFSNGKVTIKFDGYSSLYVRDASDLGLGVRCNSGICVDDRIIDSYNRTGWVVEVFSSKKAIVKFDGYSSNYVRATTDLGKRVN